MGEKRQSLLALPPEIRSKIWELLVLEDKDVILDDIPSWQHHSRPAILKVCHQIDSEASPIFWGRNVIAFKGYRLPHFVDDWGLEVMHMIKHIKMVWSADDHARIDDLEFDQVSPEDCCGLQSLEICLGRHAAPDPNGRLAQMTRRMLKWNRVSSFLLLRRLQRDKRLPGLSKATCETNFNRLSDREHSLRLISDSAPLRQNETIFDLSKAILQWCDENIAFDSY
ncbi:hypothetical protein GJ744_005927 [Endocarpon pusillum]|uniref:F-box domain-containing protein n=1 Tax=Endocarpon pusillum TaxID=364733 RepID=A0A8H7AMN0_9EURO|nr:hypothetical protein GJ744_005927 [Endocarpon pusillum]